MNRRIFFQDKMFFGKSIDYLAGPRQALEMPVDEFQGFPCILTALRHRNPAGYPSTSHDSGVVETAEMSTIARKIQSENPSTQG
jgi:hypothetical protein